jgi:hypothetical protein
MIDIKAIRTGLISDGLLAELQKAFPPPRIEVGFDKDKVLWEQAQHNVVLWIINKSARKVISGDPEVLP